MSLTLLHLRGIMNSQAVACLYAGLESIKLDFIIDRKSGHLVKNDQKKWSVSEKTLYSLK